MHKLKRIPCHLFGCSVHRELPACGRCWAHIYDGDFMQEGKLSGPLLRISEWFWRAWPLRRCGGCNRLFVARGEWCCSERCYSNWVPF